MLPKLTPRPVLSAYPSVGVYKNFFQPLMVQEIWATIYREVNTDPFRSSDWTTLTFKHAEKAVSVSQRFPLLCCETDSLWYLIAIEMPGSCSVESFTKPK